MLQDIHPHRLDMTYAVRPPRGDDFVVVLDGGGILLAADAASERIPRVDTLQAMRPVDPGDLLYLFSLDDRAFFLLANHGGDTPGHVFEDVAVFRSYAPAEHAFAGVTACHLGQWYAANRFCGKCGRPMQAKADERAVVCSECGLVIYPRISPAVIVGVVDGDRIIMTRYANRPGSVFGALIAGFMEIGETLEDTVRREVLEEVGVRVRNIRYYKSQPWAFSWSILAGFFADLEGSPEITLDHNELQEARWVGRGELTPNDNPYSLTSTMIETFRRAALP